MKIWDNLPKTVKVFFYLALSTILAEVLVELKIFEQTFVIRVSAQLINLALVFLEESVPAVRAKLKK